MFRGKQILAGTVAWATLSGIANADSLSLTDSAFVRGGAHADTPQAWDTALTLKNANNDYCRIAMMKADTSSITGMVVAADFSIYAKDAVPHTLYVYGVIDSAGFQNWTGGDTGNATWNSVATNGLFQPLENLHQIGHSNLVFLGSQTLPGANAGDVSVTVSGNPLINLLNSDTDGLLTFVFCVDTNANGMAIRPHNNANPAALNVTIDPAAVIVETTGSTGLKHPGCLQSAADINALAAAMNENDPYRDGLWSSMMSNARGRIDKTDWIPPTHIVGTAYAAPAKYAGAGLIRYINDWIINGNTNSEAAAITMLNTWADIESFTAEPGDPLEGQSHAMHWWGYLAHAADLLTSSNTSWPAVEQNAFKDMMRTKVLPIADGRRMVGYNGNWDLSATWAVMTIAVLLDDKVLFDEQIAWLKDGDTNARISHYLLASGQCQESARDQTHSSMGLTFLSLCAQTAWTQGIDLYEYDNRSVGRAFEYYAAYNLGENHLPFQVYPSPTGSNSAHDYNTAISSIGRPTFFKVYEMVYHHYKNYRGIELPHCKTVLETVTRPEEPGGNWSNHNSALYWNLTINHSPTPGTDVALAVHSNYAGRASLRLNCGGGDYHLASNGRAFTKERGVWNDGGSDLSHTNAIAATDEPALYQTYRSGNTSGSIHYHFGLPNGLYRVRLHFAEPDHAQAGARRFNVYLEGRETLDQFDIFETAGQNAAHVHETFLLLSDGQLDVELESMVDRPVIAAIEIDPDIIDIDTDGLTDGQETLLGTDPQNPDSTFAVMDTTPFPGVGKIELSWPSRSNVLYRVWQSPNLSDWTVARDWAAPASPPEDVLELDLSPSNGFFRIEAEIK